MRGKITKRLVDAARATDDRAFVVWDEKTTGFGLKVTATTPKHPAGTKTYIVEYRPGAGGRAAPKRRYTIGRHGAPWTAETARTKAEEILRQVKDGRDPAAEVRHERQRQKILSSIGDGPHSLRPDDLVKTAVETFVEECVKPKLRTWKEIARTLRKLLVPILGSKKLSELDRVDMRAFMKVAERTPGSARKKTLHVNRFLNWCVEIDALDANPMVGLKRPAPPGRRSRVLTDSELTEIWRAAARLGYPWGPFVQLLILTATRRGEVAGMRKDELGSSENDNDSDRTIWTIPGARTKNGHTHVVPLGATARALIESVPEWAKAEEVDFVLTVNGGSGLSGFGPAKTRLDEAVLTARKAAAEEAGQDPGALRPMPGWRFHDLRRTAATGMVRLGIAPHVVERALNHKISSGSESGVSDVWQVYVTHNFAPEIRRALDAWETYVIALVDDREKPGSVVSLAERRIA